MVVKLEKKQIFGCWGREGGRIELLEVKEEVVEHQLVACDETP